MDISMPIMDGYEASVKIRQIEGESLSIKDSLSYIVGLTAHSTDAYIQKCFNSGMNEFSKLFLLSLLCFSD